MKPNPKPNPNPKLSALAAVAAALAATLMSTSAWAHADQTSRFDARQERQAARIAQGYASGALTLPEARWLQREQRGIARAEQYAKADGRVTLDERRRLEHMQDLAGRHIRRQAHDGQTRR